MRCEHLFVHRKPGFGRRVDIVRGIVHAAIGIGHRQLDGVSAYRSKRVAGVLGGAGAPVAKVPRPAGDRSTVGCACR